MCEDPSNKIPWRPGFLCSTMTGWPSFQFLLAELGLSDDLMHVGQTQDCISTVFFHEHKVVGLDPASEEYVSRLNATLDRILSDPMYDNVSVGEFSDGAPDLFYGSYYLTQCHSAFAGHSLDHYKKIYVRVAAQLMVHIDQGGDTWGYFLKAFGRYTDHFCEIIENLGVEWCCKKEDLTLQGKTSLALR